MSKLDLFDENDGALVDVKINKEYAKKYEHIKKMKDIQRANQLEKEAESEEDTSDEEGMLILTILSLL